jgi:urea transport system ATP-binding protein
MMLSINALNQSYGQSHTLWDLDMSIDRGACVSLIGRNGVGKTTLLECIMGLLPVDSGSMRYSLQESSHSSHDSLQDPLQKEGRELTRLSVEDRASLRIGYVPQGRMIFPLLTVEENLQIGFGALPRAERRIPSLVYELFPVLKDMLARRGGDLSGGQQQQLAIGRALVLGPEFLILDEPTEGIQPNIVHQIGDVICQLNEELGMTVLVVEQKLPFVRRVASEFFIMTKGSIVASGTMAELDESLIQKHLSV